MFIKWTLAFMAFSAVGWVYETLWDAFANGLGFVMRASLIGPWCPIYGIGGVLIVAVFDKFAHVRREVGGVDVTPVLTLLGIAALVLAVELVGSYVCELLMGEFPWDYSGEVLNFEGRVALRFTTIFAVGGMFFLYVMWPWICKRCDASPRQAWLLAATLLLLFTVDVAGEALGAWDGLVRSRVV